MFASNSSSSMCNPLGTQEWLICKYCSCTAAACARVCCAAAFHTALPRKVSQCKAHMKCNLVGGEVIAYICRERFVRTQKTPQGWGIPRSAPTYLGYSSRTDFRSRSDPNLKMHSYIPLQLWTSLHVVTSSCGPEAYSSRIAVLRAKHVFQMQSYQNHQIAELCLLSCHVCSPAICTCAIYQ